MHRHDDARTLAPAAQAHVRRLAVKAVRAGSRQTAAAQTYGVSLRAVNTWVAIHKVAGLRALKPKRRGRRRGQGGRLRVGQGPRIRSLIVGAMPNQLKLPFYLWTRAAVASLIAREYGITVSLVSVGRYLRAWGLSPQKPVRRAYERNDAAITRWLKQEYPAIARQARRDKAAIYWGDEMGLRSDHVTGTSYAPVGRTPVIRATGQRFGCNMFWPSRTRGRWPSWSFRGSVRRLCLWRSCGGYSSRSRERSI